MNWSIVFFGECIALGTGLAMDAFSVAMANGLNEPKMRRKKMVGIAGVFAFFQGAMPLIGWFLVHTLVQYFTAFKPLIPWIALILLVFIGGKMLLDGIRSKDGEEEPVRLGIKGLLVQGIATSIDALSVGCTIAEYNLIMALTAAFIIAVITFFICVAGLIIGKKFGTKLAGKAQIFGGVILIFIGIEIFVTSFF